MKKIGRQKGITLVALVITIIILLILAGITIAQLTDSGLFTHSKQVKKDTIKAEMKEQLVLALQELQIEKLGYATIDDVTQEWADGNKKLKENYNTKIEDNANANGKKTIMRKSGVIGRFLIDGALNVTEIEYDGSIYFNYTAISRNGNIVTVEVVVQEEENGIETIEVDGQDTVNKNGEKGEVTLTYELELGKTYNIKIISTSGKEKIETILINDYYHTITRDLGEGAIIDNLAVKSAYNKPYEAKITVNEEYIIDNIFVTMGEEALEIDKTTGTINIDKVTGDIKITVETKKINLEDKLAYKMDYEKDIEYKINDGVTVDPNKKYFSFDGNSYLSIDLREVISNEDIDCTISFWYRTNINNRNQIITTFGENGLNYVYNVHFFTINDNVFTAGQGFATCNVALTNETTLCDGNWHFVTAEYSNNNKVKLYFDNNIQEQSGSYTCSDRILNIGGPSSKWDGMFTGDISGFRLYNRILTDGEVSLLRNKGKSFLGIE